MIRIGLSGLFKIIIKRIHEIDGAWEVGWIWEELEKEQNEYDQNSLYVFLKELIMFYLK